MRLIRFGPVGKERPGIISDDGERRSLADHFADWDFPFFGEGGMAHLANFVATHPAEDFPLVPEGERWGSPIGRPGKIICIGLNYSDHAKESGMPIPTEP